MGKSSAASSRGESKSPKQPHTASPTRSDAAAVDSKADTVKPDPSTDAEATKPLAPPPRPGQQQNGNTPDFFSGISGSLNLEPNPFEQSFGVSGPETPGGTKLPSVAALTSPSSLLPGGGTTPFNWGPGTSLRTGPLSPAMLSGPQNDYFGDTHLRGSFPTPNESSLRTGLTPGGSGSMFPAPSPNTAALFQQLQSGGATPSTLEFHRTAINAAAANAKRDQQGQSQSVTSQPQEIPNGTATVKSESKAATEGFGPHDNDAANGLYMLAQGRNGAQPPNQYGVAPQQQQVHGHPAPGSVQQNNTSPQMKGGSIGSNSVRGVSEAGSAGTDESEQVRPNTRAKGKRNSGASVATTNGRRKAEEPPAKAPASKKAKTNGGPPSLNGVSFDDEDMSSDEDSKHIKEEGKSKMTDEEKRKNFLERNRVAALKCRQRKKQWLANLQSKVELYSSENDALTAQIASLREEVVNLKTLLLAHKDCPVTQQQGLHGAFMQSAAAMEQYNPQMNPYGMAAGIPNQPVMAGQVGGRRFS